MLPEVLRPFAPERLAGAFEHSITWEDDVWKADPLDVDRVHQTARRRFQELLTSVADSKGPIQNRILLFHGHSGAGKTHLIRTLRTHTHRAEKGYFGYAQMTPDVASYAEYYLRRLINSLEKPYDPCEQGSETALMRLSNHMVSGAGAVPPDWFEQLREAALENDALARLVSRLADWIIASPRFADQELDVNIVRALVYLQRNDPSIDQRVRQYLYGRQLNEMSRESVSALDPHAGPDRAFEIIECLGRIMKVVDGAALVFCIDQVEDLRFFDDTEERVQRAVRDLIQIANRVSSSIIVISCLDDFYAEIRRSLPQSYVDRIEKSGPVLLTEARNSEEARLIVSKRVAHALDGDSAEAVLPQVLALFGDGFFSEIAGLSTRRLLEHAQKRWRGILGEPGAETEAVPVEELPAAGDVIQAIKTRWDRFIQDNTPEIPTEDIELMSILSWAMGIVREEAGGGTELKLAPLEWIEGVAAADVGVQHPGHPSEDFRLFVCNRTNQGGGLKRQLERIVTASDDRAPVLVRASEFPPNAKGAVAQLVRRIQTLGGRRLVAASWEWERMLSLQEFQARTRREPGFQSWLREAKLLSDLPTLRTLMHLDLLTVRSEPAAQRPILPTPQPKPSAAAGHAPAPTPVAPRPSGAGLIAALEAMRQIGPPGSWPRMPSGLGKSEVAPSMTTTAVALDPSPEPDDDDILSLGDPIVAESEDGLPSNVVPLRPGQTYPELMTFAEADAAAPPEDYVEDPEGDWDRFAIGAEASAEQDPISLTKNILRRHVAVLGGSGSGKTTLALSVIEQLLLRGIPVVLIDRKGDLCSYANPDVWRHVEGETLDRRGAREELATNIDVAVYTPGRTSGRPINITLLPNGIAELPSHEQQLLANVSAAAIGEMLHLKHSATHQRQSGILAVALKVLGSKSRSEVRLGDLIRLLEEDDEELIELTQRMDASGKARRDLMAQLDSLRHRNAALFEGLGEPLRMDALLGLGAHARSGRTRLSIVYTGFLGDNENVLFWVSQFLSEALRFCQRNPSEKLQAVIMFDEADLYIPAGSKPATKEPLESLLKRARSAGVGLMLATQSPGDLDYRSRDQITSWFIGRVREDTALKKLRAAFASESGLDPARVLPNQTVGEFHLIQEGKVKAMKSRRSLISAEQVPFDRIEQLARETKRQEAHQLKLDFG